VAVPLQVRMLESRNSQSGHDCFASQRHDLAMNVRPWPKNSVLNGLVAHVRSMSFLSVGSGKTAAFSLPLLERLLFRNKRLAATYALVLTPVRELAVQVMHNTHRFPKHGIFRSQRVAPF
jgi:hypothetical protein